MTHRRLALCTVVAGISCSDRVSFRVFGDNEIQNVSKHNECDRYNDVSQRLHWMGRKKRCLEHNVSKMMPTTPPGPSTGNNDTQTYLSGTNIKARNSDSPAVVDNKKVQKCQFVGSLISGKCIAMGDSQIHTSHERGGYISHKSTTSASITNSIDTENKNEEKDSVQAGMKANSNNRRKLKASRDSKTGRNPNINNDNISYSINDIDSKSNNNIRDHSTPTLSPSPPPSPPLPRTELADFSGSLPEYLNNLLSLSGGNLEEIHEFANKLDKVTMTQIQNVQNIQVPSLQDYLSETVQDSIASGAVDSLKDNTPMINALAKELVMDYLSVSNNQLQPQQGLKDKEKTKGKAKGGLQGLFGRSPATEEVDNTPVRAFGRFLRTLFSTDVHTQANTRWLVYWSIAAESTVQSALWQLQWQIQYWLTAPPPPPTRPPPLLVDNSLEKDASVTDQDPARAHIGKGYDSTYSSLISSVHGYITDPYLCTDTILPALYAQIRQFTHIDPAHAGEGMLHGGSKAEPSDAVDEIEINCMEEQQRNMIAGSPLHELVSEQLVVVKPQAVTLLTNGVKDYIKSEQAKEAAKSAIINYLHHQNEHKQEEQNQHHQQHHFVESQQQSLRLSTNSVFKCAHGTPDAAPR